MGFLGSGSCLEVSALLFPFRVLLDFSNATGSEHSEEFETWSSSSVAVCLFHFFLVLVVGRFVHELFEGGMLAPIFITCISLLSLAFSLVHKSDGRFSGLPSPSIFWKLAPETDSCAVRAL